MNNDLKEKLQALKTYCEWHGDDCQKKGNCPMCNKHGNHYFCQLWEEEPFLWDVDDMTERLNKVQELATKMVVIDGELKEG